MKCDAIESFDWHSNRVRHSIGIDYVQLTLESRKASDICHNVRVIERKYSMRQKYIYIYIYIFFSIWVFFHKHSRFTGQQGKGEGIYLTPLYHFHPLHRHLDISRAITAESSPLHSWQPDSSREPLVSERKSLTTKLRALNNICSN